jgi:fatty acid desaturase
VSYYGVANTIAFNVGFHVEHHDFPRVPWSRLPALRRAVPGYYEPLAFVRSWTGLLVAHILDRRQHRGLYVGATEEMVESFSGTSWASGLARGSASGAGTLR